jgi:hypothetical protein
VAYRVKLFKAKANVSSQLALSNHKAQIAAAVCHFL